MATREVYQVNQQNGKSSYAGYAKFGSDGSFQGTYGGKKIARNGASQVQNTINTAGARQAARRRRAGL